MVLIFVTELFFVFVVVLQEVNMAINFQTLTRVLVCEISKIFKKTLFTEHLRVTVS